MGLILPDPIPVRIRSHLPVEQVLARLQERAEPDRFSMWLRVKPLWKPMVVWISERRLRVRQHRNYKNDLGPYLWGELTEDGRGCLFAGEIGLHPFVRIVIRAFLGFIAFGAVASGALFGESRGIESLATIEVMVAGVLLGARIGWLLGTHERRRILAFMRR